MTNSANAKIESLQALRALAIIGIFLAHAHSVYHWAGLGVSVFFVMSGFLLLRQDISKPIEDPTVKGNFRYALKKIKKVYPLHLYTMLFAVVLECIWLIRKGITFLDIARLSAKICLNASLLHAWVPFNFFDPSLNDVSWFLSAMLFLYFIYPWVKRWVLKQRKEILIFCGILALLIQTALCVPWVLKYNNSYAFYEWFMYSLPVFRTGDLIVGCVLGRLFFEKQIQQQGGRKTLLVWSVFEVLMSLLTVILSVWPFHKTPLILRAFHNWTTPYIIVSAGWLILFTLKRGLITKGFSCKPFIYLGNISASFFLIHYIVIGYIDALMKLLFQYTPRGIVLLPIMFVEFILSVIISGIYQKAPSRLF